MSAALLLLVLVPVLVVLILWQAGVIGKKDSEEDPADTEEETRKEEEAKAAKAKAEAEAEAKAKAAEEEAAKKRAQELIAEVTAGKTKPLEEMSVKELTDELTKAMVATGGDESDPKVKKLMELIRGNIAATDDAIGMPSTADIAAVQQTAAKTGLETASVQTMSYVQRMFREIFKFSARDLTSKLTAAFTKTYDAEADRLRSIRDNLTEGSKVREQANNEVNEFRAQWASIFKPFTTYLTAPGGSGRSASAVAVFLTDMGVKDKFDAYVPDLYAWVRLDAEKNTQKVIDWLSAEKYKLEPLGGKALGPIMEASDSLLKNGLKEASHKAMDKMLAILINERDQQKTIAERGAKEVKIAEFERLSDSAEAAFGRVINSEPRGAMFQAIWTLFDIQTLTLPDISTFVSRPFDWVGKSDENAQRMREFVFGNEFFK